MLTCALQKKAVKAISALPALGETDSTFLTPTPVLLKGEARLEAAIVATMNVRSEVASIEGLRLNLGSYLTS
jgi:hypothetical protein